MAVNEHEICETLGVHINEISRVQTPLYENREQSVQAMTAPVGLAYSIRMQVR